MSISSCGDDKRCVKCAQLLPLAKFYRNKASRDGKHQRCKPCMDEATRLYRETHADQFKVSHRATTRAYWATHRDAVKHRQRAWRKKHPDKSRAQSKRAYLKNPSRYHARSAKRRASVAGSPVVEHISRRLVYTRDEGICWLCSKHVPWNDYHMDHVIPISKGGEHSYRNVRVSHSYCNLSKGTKLVGA